jgi:hypothetical protein
MPRFTIYPIDQGASSTDVTALDASAVLHKITRLHCKAADVHRDGRYVFSVQASDSGAWTIFQHNEELAKLLVNPVKHSSSKRRKSGDASQLKVSRSSDVDQGQRVVSTGAIGARKRSDTPRSQNTT